jgi:selenocysteine-specific elongation factor
VAVNLSGVTTEEVRRGDVVALPGLISGTQLIDVTFRHLADAGRSLEHNSEVKFFSGAAEMTAHVRLLGNRSLAPGAQGWLQLRLADPIALDKGDRFILRYPSPPQTIGGGIVLDPHPAHRWRRFKPEVLSRLQTLAAGSGDEILLHALEGGQTALLPSQAQAATGLDAAELSQAAEALDARGDLLRLPDGWLMARASWNRLVERLHRELAAYHAEHRLRLGMPREALRSRLALDAKVFNRVMGLAAEKGIVTEEGAIVRLPGHRVEFSPQEQAAIDRLWETIRAQPDAQPSVKETAAIVGDDVLQALLERGDLVQISADVLLDARTYVQWTQEIREFIGREGSVTAAQVRDQFNTTRKYAIALLEHLDTTGVTRRVGDERVLRS